MCIPPVIYLAPGNRAQKPAALILQRDENPYVDPSVVLVKKGEKLPLRSFYTNSNKKNGYGQDDKPTPA
jgi:hypothetical protein